MANFDEVLHKFCQRMGGMVLRAISRLVAVLITIFVIWHEFPELVTDALFLWLLMTWGIYGVIVFWLDYRQAKKRTTDEKLDELIQEIRADRMQTKETLQYLKKLVEGKENGK